MVAKRFLYVSAGLLCLALAYHFGAVSATAQAGSAVSGIAYSTNTGDLVVLTTNGDVFTRNVGIVPSSPSPGSPPQYVGNYWSGTTPTQQETWGAMKSRYRGERGDARPSQDR